MLRVDDPEYFGAVMRYAATRGSGPTATLLAALRHPWLGGPDPDGRYEREEICELHKDFAPYSFTFTTWFRVLDYDGKEDEMQAKYGKRNLRTFEGIGGFWARDVFGGLIYQGPSQPADGSFPSLTVSISPGEREGWFIHT